MDGVLELEVAPGPAEAPPAEDRRAAETRRLVDLVRRMPEVRMDKVRRMRHLILRGGPETPNRIDGTIPRLLEELGPYARIAG